MWGASKSRFGFSDRKNCNMSHSSRAIEPISWLCLVDAYGGKKNHLVIAVAEIMTAGACPSQAKNKSWVEPPKKIKEALNTFPITCHKCVKHDAPPLIFSGTSNQNSDPFCHFVSNDFFFRKNKNNTFSSPKVLNKQLKLTISTYLHHLSPEKIACHFKVAFTRNPSTGSPSVDGEFLLNAQGEDVVEGLRRPQELTLKARLAHGSDEASLEEAPLS